MLPYDIIETCPSFINNPTIPRVWIPPADFPLLVVPVRVLPFDLKHFGGADVGDFHVRPCEPRV